MKKLAQLIYTIFYWIDTKFNLIEEYSYETAPYCGHHYSGHTGKFTRSEYQEGMGGCRLNTENPFFKGITQCSESGWHWYICWKFYTRLAYDHTTTGIKCTPVYLSWYYHGNILLRKTRFVDKWWSVDKNKDARHILGFRFTRSLRVGN